PWPWVWVVGLTWLNEKNGRDGASGGAIRRAWRRLGSYTLAGNAGMIVGCGESRHLAVGAIGCDPFHSASRASTAGCARTMRLTRRTLRCFLCLVLLALGLPAYADR